MIESGLVGAHQHFAVGSPGVLDLLLQRHVLHNKITSKLEMREWFTRVMLSF